MYKGRCVLCCVCVCVQPILVHMSKDADGKFAYSPISVNFLTEVVKCLFAVVLLIYHVRLPSALP